MKGLKRLFLYLNGIPWTKPVAIITCGAILIIFLGAWVTGRDVPPNATQIGIWFGSAVFAVATGKSAYEHKQDRDYAKGAMPHNVEGTDGE